MKIYLALVIVAIAGCADIPETTPNQPPTSLTSSANSIANLEQEIHRQINQYRQSKNLPPLRLNPSISQQSKIHSQNMAQGKVSFSHDGFEQRVQAIGRTIAYKSAAENVAYNQGHSDPVTAAVQGWLKSPGHRRNIEGQFDLTGIGVVKNTIGEYYFTQIFIKQR